MKYVKKPYGCSKCHKAIHMKRTLKLMVTEKSEGYKPATKKAIRSNPDLCLDCYDEIREKIQNLIMEEVYGIRRTEEKSGGDNPELSVPLHSEGQKDDDKTVHQQCDKRDCKGSGE